MSSELRKRFYERFAREANGAGITWAVLSGIEGYPNDIGRDLDVARHSALDADLLCETFVTCLHEQGFRWIVFPSPIWGRRILGITERYDTVELHIVHPVRMGWISLTPTWNALDYEGDLFPIDPLLRFFKRCLMPALAGSEAWRPKCAQTQVPDGLPWWMRSTVSQVRSGRDLTGRDRLRLFSAYLIGNSTTAIVNLVRWQVRRGVRGSYPAAPVYQLAGRIDPDNFHALAKRSLSEVFTGVVCVDDYSSRRVKELQAAQCLVFLSKVRGDIHQVREIVHENHSEAELLQFVVEEFCRFNERWRPNRMIVR